jgi:hypothetical protein
MFMVRAPMAVMMPVLVPMCMLVLQSLRLRIAFIQVEIVQFIRNIVLDLVSPPAPFFLVSASFQPCEFFNLLQIPLPLFHPFCSVLFRLSEPFDTLLHCSERVIYRDSCGFAIGSSRRVIAPGWPRHCTRITVPGLFFVVLPSTRSMGQVDRVWIFI